MGDEVLNISPFVVWVIALSQLLTFGLTLWNLFAAGGQKNARRLEEHATALNTHNNRISALELAHLQMPSRKNFHDLEVTMTELKGSIAVLNERLRPLEAITDRMQDLLIEQGKK